MGRFIGVDSVMATWSGMKKMKAILRDYLPEYEETKERDDKDESR